VPTDANGIAFSRTPGDVLNIVYLTAAAAQQGGFFPAGVNGTIRGTDRFSVYAGGGFGRARAKLLGNRDDAWAHQLIAGARFAVSDNIDFGLKYRYFRTARLDLGDAETTVIQGNPDLLNLGTQSSPVFVERRTSVALDTRSTSGSARTACWPA
jgi:hypothetical protein